MVVQGYLSLNDIRRTNRVRIGIDLKAGNRNHVLDAVRQNGYALQYASDKLRGDKEITMAAMINNSGAGKFSSIEDQDKRTIEELISKSERELQTLCNKSDQFTTLFCVVKNGRLLQHASEELKGNREVVLAAVRQDGYALEYASEELKGDREVVLEAVKQDGYALEHASAELKGDREVVLEAVKQDGRALQYASAEL
ncbi:hypothetical protein CL648_02200, partial [bacterium]|nr:hypothetical protein [bacterium]